MISQGSVLSTINVIGIPHELGNLDDWQEEPLIKYLTEKILRSSINDVQLSEKASLLLNGALKRAWELDERYREKTIPGMFLKKFHALWVRTTLIVH